MATVGAGEVYRDILEWGSSLPLWQQELLRRVLPERDLANADIDELAAAAVAESEQQPSAYLPLSIGDLPSVAATEEPRILVGLTNVKSVNALRSDQNLTFSPQLTIVYGDNGSGKSGYARVLKKVYRARVVEDILGNLGAEKPSLDPCGATFTSKVIGGDNEAVDWLDGTPAANVGRFAVLDTACASTYVRGGTLAVGPSGIDVPRRFTEELDRVKRQLGRLVRASTPNKSTLQRLENDTEAGRFVKGLSSATADADVTRFEAWSADDAARLLDCERLIADAKAQAPSVRRTQLRTRLRALQSIHTRLTGWRDDVSDSALQSATRAAQSLEEADAALRAVKAVADPSVQDSYLHGRPWLDLLAAAKRYVLSLPEPEPGSSFTRGGQCALCWQPLDGGAQARMQRFADHLEGTAVNAQRTASEAFDAALARLRAVPDALSAEEEGLLEVDPDCLAQVQAAMAVQRGRRDAIVSGVVARMRPQELEASSDAALESVQRLVTAVQDQLGALPAGDAEVQAYLTGLERQVAELKTRQGLSELIEDCRRFVRSTREHQRLSRAESSINTRAASNQASRLHEKHLTERYAVLVNDELRELRFRRRRPVLAQATNKGTVQVTPLVSEELAHIPADKVFSEGERTSIALACFLAELNLGDDPSGLIFDDPVSSLDHNVREHVARRLVASAKNRQVIVFTHDLAFLADLREQAQKIQDVDCDFRTLSATDYDAGFVEDEEPFGARSVSKRIKALRQLLVDIERFAKAGEMMALRLHGKDFYERLRSTWERFIEERLFAKVVQRLERNVTAGALSKVAYTPELGEKAHEGWRRCSNAIEAHDHAPAAGGQSYSVEEMKADFELLVEAEKATPQS